MAIDPRHRYETGQEFFALAGTVSMRLTTNAAIEVCRTSASHGVFVARIEGGIWHYPGFEARVDCIWDSLGVPKSSESSEESSRAAIQFILDESVVHDVFVITVLPLELGRG